MARKLTSVFLEKVRPHPTKRLEIPDAGKPGLFLVVQPSGKKSWAVRYRRLSDGKPRKLTLDGFVSLATAHKLAQQALDAVAEGKDPAAEKQASRVPASSDIFADVAAEFLRRHIIPNASDRYRYETQRILHKDVLPLWGHRDIASIRKRDVIELLDAIVDRGGGVSANRVLATVRKLFNWAISRGIIETSPAQGIKAPIAENPRDRILTDDEILSFWKATGEIGYPWGPLARLLLLTGQRRTEVAAMTWSELHLDVAEWHIPGTRTKNREAHVVPLASATLAVISSLPRIKSEKGYLFTASGRKHITSYSDMKDAIDNHMHDKHMPNCPPWVLHDLRRTAASGMARLGINLPIIEKVLNHTSGSFAGIVGVYQRHSFADEKRSALEAWANFVLSLQNPSSNVTRLQRVLA
jgi:integrase